MPTYLPATPGQSSQTRDFVKGVAQNSFGAWGDMVFDPSEYIASDVSGADPLTQADHAIARGACRAWASANKDGLNVNKSSVMAGNCKKYLEDEGLWPDSGLFSPTPKGGQCEGIGYEVHYKGTQYVGNPPAPVPVERIVPMGYGALIMEQVNSGPLDVLNNVLWVTGRGSPGGAYNQRAGFVLEANFLDGTPSTRDGAASVVRSDGQPDNCGNLPGLYGAPGRKGTPNPQNVTIPSPTGGPGIGVDIQIGPDGDIVIDVPDYPGEPIEPIDPTNPPSEPTAIPEVAGDQGSAGSSGSTGQGGTDEGDTGSDVLVGLLVEVLDFPASANILFTPAGPVYKGAVWVYMGGDAGLELDTDGALLAASQFFTAPPKANRWLVRANPGYNLRVTPYYREPE